MESYYFANQEGSRHKAEANNSDQALERCMEETGWKMGEICYLGRAAVVEAPGFDSKRNEIKFLPGGKGWR